MANTNCPQCGFVLVQDLYFCPNCGKKLKEKPLSTTFLKQVVIYTVSFFLAPLGLVWAFKYLRQPDPIAKRIGIVVIVITVVAIIVVLKVALDFYRSLYTFLWEGAM